MVFKLTVFALILVAIAWLGTRGYRDAVRRFEAGRAPAGDQGDGSG
jgi:hypothetical protein